MTRTQFGKIKLRDEYQAETHQLTIDHCKNYNGPAINDHSVGAGKTVNIGAMCCHVTEKGGLVLVLARQGELIEQNSNDAFLMGCKNSIFSSSLGQKSTFYNCVMGTEKTVNNHLHDYFKPGNFIPDLLLLDECHHADIADLNKLAKDLSAEVTTVYGNIFKHFMIANPKLRVIGYTGSPFRGKLDILGNFWLKKISTVSTMYLVNLGYLVPPVFGFGDNKHKYDLSEFKKTDEHEDYTQSELVAMQRVITKDQSMTHRIINEVIDRTSDRNSVLITCSGKKHCEQVAECLPAGSYAIITETISTKKRREILSKVKSGEIKYTIQIGCLTTGVNVPIWDVCVILRRIGSLTLLIQLIGRVLRILKPEQVDLGLIKNNALILDYTDTLEIMGKIFDNPILNKAAAAKLKQNDEYQECPSCDTHNNMYAVRCIGTDKDEIRCEHYFQFRQCMKCNTRNAPSAQSCRKCDAILIDPNKALRNTAYTDEDFKPVNSCVFDKTKNGILSITYNLDSTYHKDGIEYPEIAKEFVNPFGSKQWERGKWADFIKKHCPIGFRNALSKHKTIDDIIKNKAIFDTPIQITHRVNDKGFSIINHKKFKSGRIEE